ncbi:MULTISPECIES: 2-hydroxyacid dehydrogenase [Synergistaceae]|uniref:2-hydroxyacid dehydrogenase n=1 Tax=Synergistaceae TaxID=649777 RepID=UPI003AEB4285|nr:D-glycerate dehydrogenase [Synergistaceae bacterium DZ-S4]
MSLPKVFMTQRIQDVGMSILEGRVDLTLWSEEGRPDPEAVMRDLPYADGLIMTMGIAMDRSFFKMAERLRVASLYSVGYDNVDIKAATEFGVMVTNTPGVLTDATADTALMLMLMTARKARENEKIMREGGWTHWSPNQFVGKDLSGSVLGIVGFGDIGRAVAKRAAAFGMKVIYTGRSRKIEHEEQLGAEYLPLEELLKRSDFVSLNCALTNETSGLIGERELRMMKNDAVLINTARGAVVDQKALFMACSEGWIYGAGLDVYEKEPVPMDEPLLELENVVMMPHIGSAAKRSREGMARLAATNLVEALEGRVPPNLVNPGVLIEKRP